MPPYKPSQTQAEGRVTRQLPIRKHLFEPGQPLIDALQAGFDSHLGVVLVRGVRQVPFLGGPRDEGRGDRGGGDGQEGDALKHHEGRDDSSRRVLRCDVAIAHRCHRLQSPPHADPDVRVLAMVEQPYEHSATDDYHRGRCDDDAGSGPDGRRFTQEPRHAALNDVQTTYLRHAATLVLLQRLFGLSG
jgi:hypothetical protein